MALSVLAHVLLAGYATTVQIVHNTIGPPRASAVRISSVKNEPSQGSSRERGTATKRVDAFAETPVQTVDAPEVARAKSEAATEAESPGVSTAAPLAAPTSPTDALVSEPVEPAKELAETAALLRESSPESATPLEDVTALSEPAASR